MVNANKSSKFVYAYESVPGTAIIVAVDSLSYEFGEYDELCKKWNSPFTNNQVSPFCVYNSRTPTLTDLEKKFPTFSHAFNPITAQYLSWILKSPVVGPPVAISPLTEGMTYPLTIRLEELEGTNPSNIQAVGCYCIGVTVSGVSGNPLMVDCEFAWQKIEDIGDNPNLTTDPFPSGSGDTSTITNTFEGRPQVIWDKGVGDVAFNEVVIANFTIAQDYKTTSSALGTTQTVHTYKYRPVIITLHAILKTNTQWDDYVDRNIKDLEIKFWKGDMVNYISHIFENCHINTVKKTGAKNEGHYEVIITLTAEMPTGTNNFANESAETFANHWKGVVS